VKDNKDQINDIRNVLMNEMGLSREFIRGETERVIAVTAEKHLCRLLQTGKLGEIMVAAVDAQTRKDHGSYKDYMQRIVRDAAYDAAKDWYQHNIIIKGEAC